MREVCQDLLAHQEAFLEAMTHAFVEFAERFDPEELTASFERSLGRRPFLRLLSELKYWGLYKDLYPSYTSTDEALKSRHTGIPGWRPIS